MIVGFALGSVVTAAATAGGASAAPWIALGALFVVIATVGHGWAWPRLRQWRSRRSEPGYIKVVGGYKTDNRRVIKYSDGTRDEDVRLGGASASSSEPLGTLTSTFTAEAAGTVAPSTLWKRVKRWSQK
jgi:hypothetical protein